jgi:formylmethanofuran dehydrogenase subunit A
MLMDVNFRKAQIATLPEKARQRIVLADLDREYTLSEIAIITSAGPARALGMPQKGISGWRGCRRDHLPREADERGVLFSYPRYVLKDGSSSLEEGDIRAAPEGREFVVRPSFDGRIEEYLRPLFQKVYTMSFDNYPWRWNVSPADVTTLSTRGGL